MMLQQHTMRGAARAGAKGRMVPKPFTAARPVQRSVVARVAQPEAAPEAEQSLFAELFAQENDAVDVVMDDDAKAAVRVADDLMATFTVESVLEAELASEGDKAALLARSSALVESGLESARGALGNSLETAAAIVAGGLEPTELPAVDDFQSGAGFRKYDEDEDNAVLPEARAAVQPYKLTRQELANLVPEDWATVNVDWFSSKKEEKIPLPEYKLCFLWGAKNLGVAVDQVYSRGQTSPLTEYYFWPRKDAWEELKAAIEARPWVPERDKVILLNRLTDVINFWQDESQKHTMEEARASFPDCGFSA